MGNSYFGFPERSDPNEPTVAQPPIILPAPEELQPYYQPGQQSPSGRLIRPEDMVRTPPSSLPANPLARLSHLWKKDPAYRVLLIAISIVLFSSLICGILLANAFSQSTTQRTGTNPQQGIHAASTPAPTATPIPTPTPTPTPIPTPTPVAGPLTVQITNIPNRVQNNTIVRVGVTTGVQGMTVHLSVIYHYDGLPFSNTTNTQSQNTDGQGHVNLAWRVQALRLGRTVTAQVVAIAEDQQGQQTTSEPVTVQISTN
jgi:hypothetical protein